MECTFGGNPIACSAALATIGVLKEENLVANANEIGKYTMDKLTDLKRKHRDIISDIRGIGLMIGIEIMDPITNEPSGEALLKILDYALEKGVLFYLCGNEGNVIRMVPPLIVTKDQIDEGLEMLDQAILMYKEEREQAVVGL